MRTRVYRTYAGLVLCVLPIAALNAQSDDAETLTDLKACAGIERSNARLACYDGVLGRPPGPEEPATAGAVSPDSSATPATGGPTPASASAAVGTAAVVAGTATAPAPAASTAPPRAESGDQTVVIVEVRLRAPTDATFVTDGGQVWDQIDSGRGRYPEVPFEATLERGSLGSRFLVSPAGGPRIRVSLRD